MKIHIYIYSKNNKKNVYLENNKLDEVEVVNIACYNLYYQTDLWYQDQFYHRLKSSLKFRGYQILS